MARAPVCGAGCETDEQACSVWRSSGDGQRSTVWREKADTGTRETLSGWSPVVHLLERVQAQQRRCGYDPEAHIIVSRRSERLGSPISDFTYSSYICI